jgi:hypothetical protein
LPLHIKFHIIPFISFTYLSGIPLISISFSHRESNKFLVIRVCWWHPNDK